MATTNGTTWQLDPTHSSVEFAIRHLMISTVRGRFGGVTGTVELDQNEKPTKVDVTIDMTSVDTRQDQRDNHLRSADFFDVEKYPTMRFVSTRIEGDVKGEFKLIGNLTIKDQTREVTLDVTAEGVGNDPWGNYRAGFSAKGKVDRRDFGLTWNQALEAGGFVVGDEVKISIDLELIRAAQKAAA